MGGRQGWEGRKINNQVPCLAQQKSIFDGFFTAYKIYQQYRDKMVAQGKAEQIPQRIRTLLEHQYYYSVALDDNMQQGNPQLCSDYQRELNRLPYAEQFTPRRSPIADSAQFKLLEFGSFDAEQQRDIRKGYYRGDTGADKYPDPKRVYGYGGSNLC